MYCNQIFKILLMKLASLDIPLASTQVENLSFLSPGSLENYDAVLWSPRGFLPNLGDRIERRDPNVLSATASDELLRISRYWRREFDRLLKRDGTLVVLAEPSSNVGIHTLQEVMSYGSLEPLSETLHAQFSPLLASGGPASFTHSGEPFRSLFEEIAQLMQPEVRLENWPGIPVLFDGETNPLSAYVSVVPGRVLWLPILNGAALQQADNADRLTHALSRCLDRLGFMAGISYAPWLSGYVTQQEGRSLQERQQLLRQRAALDDAIERCDSVIGEIEFYKQVVGGGGRGARLAVAESFRRNGYVVQHDWLNEQVLIVEDDGHWVVAYVLFEGDDMGQALWDQLFEATVRVRTYFNRPALPVVVDCSQNGKSFQLRTRPGSLVAQGQDKDVAVLESPALYGWLDTDEPMATLASSGVQGDTLRERLYQRGVQSLFALADTVLA